jgi:hypothetical protein
MRVPGCTECARLWEKHTDATFDFVKLDAQVKMAALRYESLVVMARLREATNAAAHRRDAALECLRQHEVTHQTSSAAAAS